MIIASAQAELKYYAGDAVEDDATVNIYLDGDDEPLDSMVLPAKQPVGLGDFPLGLGPLGKGAALTSFVTPYIDDGEHEIEIKTADAAGNESAGVSAEFAIAGSPDAPTNLAAAEGETLSVALSWTPSADDET